LAVCKKVANWVEAKKRPKAPPKGNPMTTMTQAPEILNNLLKLLAAHQPAFK
jgi:hypothetical protein